MNSLKRNLVFCMLLSLVLSACSDKPAISYHYLEATEWIYNSDSLPDSIRNFTDNYLVFGTTEADFNGENLGEYQISSDTIRITKTYFYNSNDQEHKRVDSLFTGLITKLDQDALWIRRIRGSFPLKYNHSMGNFDSSNLIKFINQKSKKKNPVKFGYISLASSSCFGNCPEFNFELASNRKFKFRCTSNCKKIGSYTGKISEKEMAEIVEILSYLNLHHDSTIFASPIDAPVTAIEIRMNNRNFYFNGFESEFQPKMKQLIARLYELTETSKLIPAKTKISFKLQSFELPVEKTITFLPPIPTD